MRGGGREKEKGRSKRNNRNESADWPCCTEREREREGDRELRLFVDIINHRSGVGTSLWATVTRRVRPARKFVDMQSSFSLPSLPLRRLAAALPGSLLSFFFTSFRFGRVR